MGDLQHTRVREATPVARGDSEIRTDTDHFDAAAVTPDQSAAGGGPSGNDERGPNFAAGSGEEALSFRSLLGRGARFHRSRRLVSCR